MLPNSRRLKEKYNNPYLGVGGTQSFKMIVFKQQQKWKSTWYRCVISLDIDADGKLTQAFNLCCSSKVATEDIFSDNFVYKLGKICFVSPQLPPPSPFLAMMDLSKHA